jgi:hypothetical protein
MSEDDKKEEDSEALEARPEDTVQAPQAEQASKAEETPRDKTHS